MRRPMPNPAFNPFVNPTVLPNGKVFVPTGKPVQFSYGKEDNDNYDWNPWRKIKGGFPNSVQVFFGRTVGFNVGKRRVGSKISENLIRGEFIKQRKYQVGIKNVGVTFIAQRGAYEGKPENSIQIVVMYFPSPKEPTFAKFIKNILILCEDMRIHFGQKSVYANFYKGGRPFSAYELYQ